MIPSALVREVMTPEPLGRGDGKESLSYLSHLHPQEFFCSQFGGNLSGREGLDLRSFRFHQMKGLIEERSHQFLVGHDGRDRIAGNSDDGPIL